MDTRPPAATLPAVAYHDAAWYAAERHAVFAAEWQLAGFRTHLRRPGDFVTHDLAGWSVVVVVDVDEWRGFVFARLAADGPTLADALGTLPARCADQPIETLTYSHRLEHTVDANWKTYTDNYGEGYHVPLVHPGLHRQIDAREYCVTVHDGWAEHTAPARDGAIATGVWLWRYPNLGLNLSTEGMNVERWVPDGRRRTRIIYDFFFADVSPSTEAARREVERFGVEVLDED